MTYMYDIMTTISVNLGSRLMLKISYPGCLRLSPAILAQFTLEM